MFESSLIFPMNLSVFYFRVREKEKGCIAHSAELKFFWGIIVRNNII